MWLEPIPWAGRVWALPFLTVLAPSERYNREQGQRHKKLTDWTRQMIRKVQHPGGEPAGIPGLVDEPLPMVVHHDATGYDHLRRHGLLLRTEIGGLGVLESITPRRKKNYLRLKICALANEAVARNKVEPIHGALGNLELRLLAPRSGHVLLLCK